MNEKQNPAKSVFLQAAEISAAEERQVYLASACGDNQELRREVEELLIHQEKLGSFLEKGPNDPITTAERMRDTEGTVIGFYKLLEQIGEGGFGVVFLAEQTQPIRRKVALKILKPGMESRQVIARFEAERQALAIMDHLNIAKVFDGGMTSAGRPYFVMEWVKGVPITQFCDENKLAPRQRLELFLTVCQAVQHAHQKGIIHRDLKPSNVLVSRHDMTPIVKVIDFGVAKAMGQELTDKTLFTAIAQMIGTPLYMSPEQAGMSDLDIDTRSDIYSLGVLLYELLTGTTPFTKDRFKQAAYDEIRRIIREEEPPRPSTRLHDSKDSLPSISAQRQTEPAKLTKMVRGELDWIVMKALEKDRNRRYETANGFAMDVHRYLADEPVQACPPSGWYRFRKFSRRNSRVLLTLTLLALALLAGSIISTWQALRAQRAEALAESRFNIEKETRARAETEAAKATAISELLQEMLSSANPDQAKGADYTVRQLLDDSSLRLRDQLKEQPEVEAAIRAVIGNAYRHFLLMDKAEPHLQRALAIRRELASNGPEAQGLLAQSLHDYGKFLYQFGRIPDCERYEREAVAIYKQRGVRDGRIIATYNLLQLSLYQQKRYDDSNAVAEEALAFGSVNFPEGHAELANVLHHLADTKRAQGDLLAAEALARRAVSMHQRWHGETHLETAWGLLKLANIHADQRLYPEAESGYRRALTIFRKQYGDSHDLTFVLVPLQRLLEGKGDQAGLSALRADQTARLVKELEQQGNNLRLRILLGKVLRDAGDFNAALTQYAEVTTRDHKLADAWAGSAECYLKLGDGHAKSLKRQEATAAFQDATAIYEKLVADDEMRTLKGSPTTSADKSRWRQDLGYVCVRQGELLHRLGQLADAAKNLSRALEVHEKLVVDYPKVAIYKSRLGWNHLLLGDLHKTRGQRREAEQAYRKAVAVYEEVGRIDWFLCLAYDSLAEVYKVDGRIPEAVEARQKAVVAWEKLVAQTNERDHRWRLAVASDVLGQMLQQTNRVPEAEVHYRKSLTVWEGLVRQKPDSKDYQIRLHKTYSAVVSLLPLSKNIGDWKATIDALNLSIEVRQGGDVNDWFFLAMASWHLGEKDKARKWYDQAVQWMEKNDQTNVELIRFRAQGEMLLDRKE